MDDLRAATAAPLAWRGREQEARLVAGEVSSEAVARARTAAAIAQFFLAIAELGLGRYEQARVHALNEHEAGSLYPCSQSLADVIEAHADARCRSAH